LPQPPAGSFACAECHKVMFISTISEGCWNHFISRMTAGLLYGHEVPKPCSFVPQRKRARIRMLDRAAPIQRKVLTRLSNGWSNQKIARDLGISIITVRCHTYRICRQENVADVQALAKKLNFAIAPPLTMAQRARLRRAQVQQLLLAGLTNRQIAKALDLMPITVNFDTYAIYKAHGIHGLNNKARRAFAEKLGVTLGATRVEQLRARAAELREQGLTWARIAIELEVSYATVAAYAKKIREAKRQLAENADVEAGVLRSG
jgi:DNA-binding NarL/FixJ family response regulator